MWRSIPITNNTWSVEQEWQYKMRWWLWSLLVGLTLFDFIYFYWSTLPPSSSYRNTTTHGTHTLIGTLLIKVVCLTISTRLKSVIANGKRVIDIVSIDIAVHLDLILGPKRVIGLFSRCCYWNSITFEHAWLRCYVIFINAPPSLLALTK